MKREFPQNGWMRKCYRAAQNRRSCAGGWWARGGRDPVGEAYQCFKPTENRRNSPREDKR